MANILNIIKDIEKLNNLLNDECDKCEACKTCILNKTGHEDWSCILSELSDDLDQSLIKLKAIQKEEFDGVLSQPRVDDIVEDITDDRPPQPSRSGILSDAEIASLLKALPDSELESPEINENDEAEQELEKAIKTYQKFCESEETMNCERSEQVHHPNHYAEGRQYEPYKVIYDWGLNFNLGNAVKYISRAGRKSTDTQIEDLRKAKQYIDFEIELKEAADHLEELAKVFMRNKGDKK